MQKHNTSVIPQHTISLGNLQDGMFLPYDKTQYIAKGILLLFNKPVCLCDLFQD